MVPSCCAPLPRGRTGDRTDASTHASSRTGRGPGPGHGLTVPLSTLRPPQPPAARRCAPTPLPRRGARRRSRSSASTSATARSPRAESDRYLTAVDRRERPCRDRHRRPLGAGPRRCATRSSARRENVTDEGLARIRARHRPAARPGHVAGPRRRRWPPARPAILWIAGNVHGNEESGTDAALRTLRDLADRSDCAADQHPRQRDRRPAARAEPGRPRARHPPQRLRLRHEPRLVRPHAAGDRRQAGAHAAVPAAAVHRRPRDGPRRLLLPAQRRPRLPRDQRPVDPLDQRHLRPRAAAGVHPPGHPVLQLRRLRPVLHGLRRHGAEHRVRRGRHDVREGQRRPDRAAARRAVPRAVGVAVARRR